MSNWCMGCGKEVYFRDFCAYCTERLLAKGYAKPEDCLKEPPFREDDPTKVDSNIPF